MSSEFRPPCFLTDNKIKFSRREVSSGELDGKKLLVVDIKDGEYGYLFACDREFAQVLKVGLEEFLKATENLIPTIADLEK